MGKQHGRENFYIVRSIIAFRAGQTIIDAIFRMNGARNENDNAAASILIQFIRIELIEISEALRKDSREVRFITLRLRAGRKW